MDENLPNPQGDTQNVVTSPVAPATPPVPTAPPAPVLTPTPTPPPMPSAPKPNLMLWISLAILALALIVGGGYYFLRGTASAPTPTPTQPALTTPIPTPTDRTAGWLTYSNSKYNFSFKYRPDAKVQEQTDGTINLTLLGPTQKTGTEFFDGLNMTFKPGNLGGVTLQTFVNNKMKALSAEGTVSATTSATIALVAGYKFHLETIVASDYYYLPLGTSSYLEIVDLTMDPSGQGFEQNAQDTLSSLTFSVASPSASPTGTPSAIVTP